MKSKQSLPAACAITLITLFACASKLHAQAWNLNGNTGIAATSYLGTSDAKNLIFKTNAIERGRLLATTGEWRFGGTANYTSIDGTGKLKFAGTGAYQVAGNKYVFQYSADPDYGLFFNSNLLRYEFRDGSAVAKFFINANTGAGSFSGTLKVGAYTLPAIDGTANQVLKTNGAGVLTWSADNNSGASGWARTGNAGTVAATNFIGTSDAIDFVARTNNIERLRIKSTGNVGIGIAAPVAKLQVNGSGTTSLSTSGNFVSGDVAFTNISIDNNDVQARSNGAGATLYLNYWGGATWLGNQNGVATPAVYTGADGTVGVHGYNNSAYALNVNASSSINGINITDPVDNYSLFTSKSGANNAIAAYKTSVSDFYATVYADNAGYGPGVQSYSYNGTGVTGSSSYSYGGYFSSSDGYGSYSYSSNNNALYAYNFNNSSYWAGFFVGDVYSTTGIFTGSDQNLKQNIQGMINAMSIINELKPKQYDFRHDGDFSRMNLPQGTHYGLIAQDVEKILPNLVKTSKFDLPPAMKDGKPDPTEKKADGKEFKSLNYTELIPLLIKGMQEQQATIDQQQKQIDDLKAMVTNLAQGKPLPSTGSNTIVNSIKIPAAALEQNVPNPLNGNTSIRYTISTGAKNASLLISNMNGKTVKQIPLNKEGTGVVNIETSTLSAGVYSYTLIVDGKKIDTKTMIIAR